MLSVGKGLLQLKEIKLINAVSAQLEKKIELDTTKEIQL